MINWKNLGKFSLGLGGVYLLEYLILGSFAHLWTLPFYAIYGFCSAWLFGPIFESK